MKHSGFILLLAFVFQMSIAQNCQTFTVDIIKPHIDTLVCLNKTIVLQSKGTYPNQSGGYAQSDSQTKFIWNYGDGSPNDTANGVTTRQHIYLTTGAFTVTMHAIDQNKCQSSNSVSRVVSTPDKFYVDVTYPLTTINKCQNDSIDVRASAHKSVSNDMQNFVSYVWFFNGSNVTDTTNVPVFFHDFNWKAGGGYFVTVKAIDKYKCPSQNLDTVKIQVSMAPNFDSTKCAPDSLCSGDTIILKGNVKAGTWTNNEGWSFTNPLMLQTWEGDSIKKLNQQIGTAKALPPTFKGDEDYRLRVVDNFGCYYYKTITVKGLAATFTDSALSSTPVKVQLSPSSGVDGCTWIYYKTTDSTNKAKLVSKASVIINLYQKGTYKVFLIATKQKCIDTTVSQILTVEGLTLNALPNVFKPDGANPQVFKIDKVSSGNTVLISLKTFRCTIFDRWGRKVCILSELGESWDGRIDGRNASPGVYYYVVEAEDWDGVKYNEYHGMLHLLREKNGF